METTGARADSGASNRRRMWLGVILVGVGLLGHLLAARAIADRPMAYQHHIIGFVLILLVTGAIIAGLGWRFWRGRRDITLLIVGAVQALFGLVIYFERFRV
jgi:hypothetical protein